jgi:hypothetical protein
MIITYPYFIKGSNELVEDIKEVIITLTIGLAKIIKLIRWILTTLRNRKKSVGNY